MNYFFKLASFKIAGTSYTHYFQWCSTCLCGTLYTKSGISQILCSLQHWEGAKIVPGESLQKHSNKRLICICSNFCISMTIMMKECLMALMRGQVFYLEMDRFLCSWLRDVAICAVNDQEEIGWQDVIKGYMSIEWRQLASHGFMDADQPTTALIFTKSTSLSRLPRTFGKLLGTMSCLVPMRMKCKEYGNLHWQPEEMEIFRHLGLVPAGDRYYCEHPQAKLLKRAPSTCRCW